MPLSQPDDLSIERTTDLDMTVDELWALISTSEGWSSWLVDQAELDIAAERTGTATQDGAVREVRIDDVTEGRQVSFVWWDRDDPSSRSYVQLDIVELPDGRSQLHIAEQFAGSATAIATAISWDVRMVSLWLLALHSTVMA
jgi:uncharacterized protein YndB with AHSA1/START domain